MHHVVLEKWSRGASFLHQRDPRAKIAALVVFLAVVATSQRGLLLFGPILLILLSVTVLLARLPLGRIMKRASVVLIFTAGLAVTSWLAGDSARALALLVKSYLSALAVLVVVATTPMPALLRGLEAAGTPRFLLMVTQFLYRYLFVISEEAQHLRQAAVCRGAGFHAAGRALAALFFRSYVRAEKIHRAMLARGFSSHFHTLDSLCFHASDGVFLISASLAPVLVRAAVETLIA